MPLAQATINNTAYRPSIILTSVTFVVSAYYSIFKFLPHLKDIRNTPFTANSFFVIVFWAAFTLSQFLFLFKVTRDQISIPSHAFLSHLTMFNILHLAWVLLLLRRFYLIAEILVLANFVNVLSFYVSERSYRTKTGLLYVHLPLSSFPFTWLFYTILWNGFLIFTTRDGRGHDHENEFGLAARILSNMLIFEYLFVPFVLLLLYKDWTFGILLSFLVFGIGLDQVLVKVIALQWIFAFIIATVVFLLSIVVLFNQVKSNNPETPIASGGGGGDASQRGSETEPLLA